jgi:CHAT domain
MIDLPVLLTKVKDHYVIQIRSEEVGETPQPPPMVPCCTLEANGAALALARANDAEEQVVARLGEVLFAQLFQGPNHNLYARARAISESRSELIRLLLPMAPGSPLQRIPWELLHDGQGFLARDLRCAIVRYIEGAQPVRTSALKPKIRILVTTASPSSLDELDLAAEIRGIYAAYKPYRRNVDFKFYQNTSLKALREVLQGAALAEKPFHIWHHCGHGGITKSSGSEEFRLFLEQDRQAESVGVEDILGILKKCPHLRVVVLNVCSGGSTVGLAPELARINVPSVLSFSTKIGETRARRFSRALHRGLLNQPIEVAVDTARASICDPGSETWDWSHLLLFSRRRDKGPLCIPRIPGPINDKRTVDNDTLNDLRKTLS